MIEYLSLLQFCLFCWISNSDYSKLTLHHHLDQAQISAILWHYPVAKNIIE